MLALTSGCWKKDWGLLTGTVTLDKNPIGPGIVVLEPIEGQHAGAVGPFGEDGKYNIIGARKKEGAPIGEYRVTIHSNLKDFGFDDAGKQAPIPSRYADPKTSGLAAKIGPGTNRVDFELKP